MTKTLRDDGVAPVTTAAGDGVFTGTYQPPGNGHYTVMFSADGLDSDGQAFRRDFGAVSRALNPSGDQDHDGRTTVLDVILALRYSLGRGNPMSTQFADADVNGDDAVDGQDVVPIAKKALGMP